MKRSSSSFLWQLLLPSASWPVARWFSRSFIANNDEIAGTDNIGIHFSARRSNDGNHEQENAHSRLSIGASKTATHRRFKTSHCTPLFHFSPSYVLGNGIYRQYPHPTTSLTAANSGHQAPHWRAGLPD